MRIIDRLFNSFHKRMFWLLLTAACFHIYWQSQNFILASCLKRTETLADLVDLTYSAITYKTVVGRFTVAALDSQKIILPFLKSLSIAHIIFLILMLLFLFSRMGKRYKKVQLLIRITMTTGMAADASVVAVGIRTMNAATSAEAVSNIVLAGNIMSGCSIALIVLAFLSVYVIVRDILLG